ncbi:BTB/POZ domain containing protein [Trichomonas vaginalis G3]|uniref:BTB/POZ domain containing protein n=1 Tax=Trichomonas vaginalis (strain ATCC PRA-98 / G3) TaxID=412133 RepID=A2FYA2_TRIV3|nr:protein ubiquitination [Trichomonas vaginalis G3]EAX90124.1 BTB/POZ domain containing protein [Trichomonas vaginalis G3]KAI5533810.1 protein ubiquitination [Trichomonas vaginalis G3]|eukprot:XP_001303054.1 BTB/POZ domain containing protein [Trichomonas vaginalis G3]
MSIKQKFTLNHTLKNNIRSFYLDGHFFDCTLVSGTSTLQVHKIFLTNLSEWFEEKFLECSDSMKMTTLQITMDPQNLLFSFIDSIYKGKLVLNSENYAAYLKCAVYYKFNSIIQQIEDFIMKKIVFLDATKELCNFQLNEQLIRMKFNGKDSLRLILDEFTNATNKTKIYDILSATIFANILRISKYSDDEKVALIDEFVIYKKLEDSLSEQEKNHFASVINWHNQDAYLYLVHYDCIWVPSEISRNLYSKILSNRRMSVKGFENDVKKVVGSSSISNPLSWIAEINNSKGASQTPEVSIFEMFSTLGTHMFINPVEYNLLHVSASPHLGIQRPILRDYIPANVFSNNGRYYLSQAGSKSNLPYFQLSLNKKDKFVPSSITVASNESFPINTPPKANSVRKTLQKKAPKDICIDFANSDKSVAQINCCMKQGNNLSLDADKSIQININERIEINSVRITMTSPSESGYWNFRLSGLDMKGKFLP